MISTTLPDVFSARAVKTHDFIPHVTLTSLINASKTYGDRPKEWLDSLPLPTNKPVKSSIFICLDSIDPGEAFFKKLTLGVQKTSQLLQLAAVCRAHGAEDGDMGGAKVWAEAEYMPHLSLM